MKKYFYITSFAVLLGITFSSCHKNTQPIVDNDISNFLDLKISESFKFESFSNLQTSIQLASTKETGTEIVQIFDAHPANGGKLILTGMADQNGKFTLPIRIASRLKEVYVAKLSSSGLNQYVAVPVNGNGIEFSFVNKNTVKSVDVWCNCNANDYLPDDFHDDLEIYDGETYCVDAGDYVHIKKFKLHSGGILNVCGTALIDKFQGNYSGGTISVSPSGDMTVKQGGMPHDIDNYGSLNFSSHNGDITGNFHNFGEVSSTVKLDNKGTLINDGSFTTSKEFIINSQGSLTNNCEFYVTENDKAPQSSSRDLKQNGFLINNGYIKVDDQVDLTGSGNKKTTLGFGSLIDCGDFKIEGEVVGPNSQGSQISADDDSQTSGGSDISGYVDLWVKDGNSISPNNGSKGSNVTYHDYTITAPSCDANVAPTITSSLQIGGIVNQPITPFVITATGTATISYSATNLADGLTFSSATHTISGTPTAAGSYNIYLTASNFMGDDNETLVLVVTQPTSPPVITSALTVSATVDQSFSYTVTASGTGPIAYGATNLPDGLSFNPATHEITGSPTTAGTYNIGLSVTNAGGTSTETLVLTVGTPAAITSDLTATGTAGDQFVTYTLTADGSPEISYSVSNLPAGLSYNSADQTINGTPTFGGVYNVTLQAVNSYGTDVQTLVITINEGLEAPQINSLLSGNGMKDFPYSYTITATGSETITFHVSDLPPGLTLSGSVISGIPTAAGTYNIPLSATNDAGEDTKTLVLIIGTGGGSDSDGDGVPDNLDAYPTDATRAFNSYYPDEVEYVSVAFEDLWPAYGDYDFNDFVVNLNYKMVTNAQNEMVDIIIKYQIMADGASLENGFGLVFDAPSSSVESVTGCLKFGNAVVMDPAGFEAGHTNSTVIIPIDNINTVMEGGMANTISGGKFVQTTVSTITTHFSTSESWVGMPPYNPFIFVNQDRGHEVHLKDQAPTEFADADFFTTDADASVPADGKYYRSSTGLSWGIETAINFDYPIETVDILTAHLKFAAWAQSAGVDYADWYMDNAGYRNSANIYVRP